MVIAEAIGTTTAVIRATAEVAAATTTTARGKMAAITAIEATATAIVNDAVRNSRAHGPLILIFSMWTLVENLSFQSLPWARKARNVLGKTSTSPQILRKIRLRATLSFRRMDQLGIWGVFGLLTVAQGSGAGANLCLVLTLMSLCSGGNGLWM